MSDTPSAADVQAENMRLRAALEANIPAELADRLRGSTHEELLADAGSLRAALGIPAPTPANTFDGGVMRGSTPPTQMTNRDEIRLLAKRNPRKFNEMVDSGLINLSELS